MFRHGFIGLIAVGLACHLLAAGPDDMFVTAYNLIQTADRQKETGQLSAATASYQQALEELTKIQRVFPDWNERVINYRLRYVGSRLDEIKNAPKRPEPAAIPAPTTEYTPLVDDTARQLTLMNGRLRQLTQEKADLEARLREALSAQPAPVDPRELQKAVERITALQATNQVLIARIEEQRNERRTLVDKVVYDEAQRALENANRELMTQKNSAASVHREKEQLEAELKSLRNSNLKSLQLENSVLKAQVIELKSPSDDARKIADLSGRLVRIQADLEERDRRNAALAADKAALERQLNDAQTRKTEENILRLSRLETELSVARADASRHAARAEELAEAVEREKMQRTALEKRQKGLEDRVTALTKENSGALMMVESLQDALAAEKAERGRIENRLRLAEGRLNALRTSAGLPGEALATTPEDIQSAETVAQISALEEEILKFQSGVREGKEREAEIQLALLEERQMREQLERERRDLDARLRALENGTSDAGGNSVRVAILENRVRELESIKMDLEQRLARLGSRGDIRVAIARARLTTPRERAVEFRQER